MTAERLALAVGFAAVAVAAAVLLAPPRAAEPEVVAPWLHRLDLDQDGCVSMDECRAQASDAEDCPLYDADRDGCLGPAELETVLRWVSPRWIELPAR